MASIQHIRSQQEIKDELPGNRSGTEVRWRAVLQRYIDWNFVSSRKQRIDRAKQDWKAGRFPKVPGDEEEFIPLPS